MKSTKKTFHPRSPRSRSRVVATKYGLLDPNPTQGEKLLSRNFGRGPGQIMLNMRIGKTFAFGAPREGGAASSERPGGGGPGGGGGGRGGPASPFSMGGGGQGGSPFNKIELRLEDGKTFQIK